MNKLVLRPTSLGLAASVLSLMTTLAGCGSDDDSVTLIVTTHDGGVDGSTTSSPNGDGGASEGGTIVSTPPSATAFLVGGTITGLATGANVVLQDNGGDNLTVGKNGVFQFATPVASGAAYAVTVLTPPGSPAQTCTVTNDKGTIGGTDVGNVQVTCFTSSFKVGVTVTGDLGSGLTLQNNGGDDLGVDNDGMYMFDMSLSSGSTFDVTVKTQPGTPAQTCAVVGGSGTVVGGDVTSITVNCSTSAFVVGGTISGLFGTGLVLEDNNGDDLAINTTNGTFAFPTPLADGQMYNVTVKTQPGTPNQLCTVTGTTGAGTIMSANVPSVAITCAASYAVGGTLVGLATGDSVVIQDNNGDSTTLRANGPFTFPTKLTHGSTYAVSVLTSPTAPTAQTCTLDPTGGSGTIAYADVSATTVRCSSSYFVNVATGSDTLAANDGTTAATAWKTITHAIATVPTTGAIINIAPGTYNAAAGETFPIKPKSYQSLVGDVANKGAPATGMGTATLISGSGTAAPSGGDVKASLSWEIVIAQNTTGVSIRGFSFGPSAEGVLIDHATASIDSITVPAGSISDVAIVPLNGASVKLTNSVISASNAPVIVVDPVTSFFARNTTFDGGAVSAIGLGIGTDISGANIDLGTTASIGGNTILGASTHVGLVLSSVDTGTVSAVGNTFKANVQGADPNGHYPGATITGPVPSSGGNNYAITEANRTLQL